MNSPFNSSENLNELVFENRNKEYGAYSLRKSYNSTVAKSFMITFTGICVLVVLALWMNRDSIEKSVIPVIETFDTTLMNTFPPIDIPKPPDVPKPPSKSHPIQGDNMNLTAVDHPVDNPAKPNELVVNPNNGDPKAPVDSSEHTVLPPVLPPLPPVETKPKIWVKQMPTLDDMSRIISENLHYPEIAKENGTIGTVYITFVVEKDGRVTNVKILKGIGDGCEQEAARVVSLFPKWIPGQDDDGPARVQCNLPIKFSLK